MLHYIPICSPGYGTFRYLVEKEEGFLSLDIFCSCYHYLMPFKRSVAAEPKQLDEPSR